jgi:hypothetical protein
MRRRARANATRSVRWGSSKRAGGASPGRFRRHCCAYTHTHTHTPTPTHTHVHTHLCPHTHTHTTAAPPHRPSSRVLISLSLACSLSVTPSRPPPSLPSPPSHSPTSLSSSTITSSSPRTSSATAGCPPSCRNPREASANPRAACPTAHRWGSTTPSPARKGCRCHNRASTLPCNRASLGLQVPQWSPATGKSALLVLV